MHSLQGVHLQAAPLCTRRSRGTHGWPAGCPQQPCGYLHSTSPYCFAELKTAQSSKKTTENPPLEHWLSCPARCPHTDPAGVDFDPGRQMVEQFPGHGPQQPLVQGQRGWESPGGGKGGASFSSTPAERLLGQEAGVSTRCHYPARAEKAGKVFSGWSKLMHLLRLVVPLERHLERWTARGRAPVTLWPLRICRSLWGQELTSP